MHDEASRLPQSDATNPAPKNDQSHEFDPDGADALLVPPADRRRMWAPWRMRYVGGERRSSCVFCEHATGPDDAAALVLYRDEHAYVVMNLFPYAGGHVMIVPLEHADSPEHLDDPTLVALQRMLPPVMRALRRALRCDGFNVGYNIGAAAGAGIAAHLHQHVVPRWVGDANFMPVLSGTQVLPELIPATYGKLRAELEREVQGDPDQPAEIVVVLLDPTARSVAVTTRADGTVALPTAAPEPHLPVWQAAASVARGVLSDAIFLGWAGQSRAGTPFDRAGLALVGVAGSSTEPSVSDAQPELRWVSWDDALATLDTTDRASLEAALRLL